MHFVCAFFSPPAHLQFPLGRRAACDIYWHGVSFHDNDHIASGQVNKFPGKPPPHPCPVFRATTAALTAGFIPFRHDRNAPQDQHEPGGSDHAGAVPRGVRLLPSLLDPARGVPALLCTGRRMLIWMLAALSKKDILNPFQK